MELKWEIQGRESKNYSVLIVPYGIEIEAGLTRSKNGYVLIVPYGIEICH